MKLINITNPRWMSADHTLLDVTLDVMEDDESPGPSGIPYTVVQGTPLWDDAVAGKFGAISDYVEPQRDFAQAITTRAAAVIEAAYGNKRSSANNYFTVLTLRKSDPAGMSNEDERDLDALVAAADWEQSVLYKRDDLLQSPNAENWAAAQDAATWPPFPEEAATVIATC
jgi:hypothetical protein